MLRVENESRDAWCLQLIGSVKLRDNIARSVDFYNEQVAAFQVNQPHRYALTRTDGASQSLRGL